MAGETVHLIKMERLMGEVLVHLIKMAHMMVIEMAPMTMKDVS